MPEQYDIVVIGAGHNGLCAALDLARAGLSVRVVEAGASVGGCATTREPLLPGFRHSPHANAFLFADLMPERISPAALKVGLHHPEAQLGVAFADGRPPAILHRPDLLARTRRSLGVHSRKDAATYAELKLRSARLGALIGRGLYMAPDRKWFVEQADAVRSLFKGHVDTRSLGEGSARMLIDRLFEAPAVRVLLYHLATETGLALEERGGDIAFLGYSLWIAGRWRVPVGGMGAYATALGDAARAAGVMITCSTGVARVILENGRAVGVETRTGETIRAAIGVVAAAPLLNTFDDMVAATAISPSEQDELAAFRRQRPGSIAGSHFCLTQAPHYKSARHDPQIDACLKTIIGHETPADVLANEADIRAGLLPKPAGVVRLHSLWDPTQAPFGRHVAGVDSRFPALNCLDQDSWRMVESAFPDAFWGVWNQARADSPAPPLAMSSDFSSPFERRMLVRMGPDQYRTSVQGLYLAGPGVYPGGGVHGACGRNAARTVLADVGAMS
ncbi:NAD(P)/FAD-dependent oxidoreductase [Niveispirillum sp.]|uniref:phytoene desaturase family protein n=1 Tax=Niveispirillum sp. TaxID=1917217 RepID=UPI001B528735|nr:NAD(P)/FAD-dependent oxidoreductase [Niveispirillum sp.]MBP7335702.1 NAD(P)/FAD-dependent oxidoreductase [Niveispirillum sp.]